MRVAIVGGGVSGLVCAHLLHGTHDVTLFEREPRLGGHSHTIEVALDEGVTPVDTGFIVYNERNYPRFTALLASHGVRTRPAPMSFSVRCDRTGFEYGGGSLGSLLAQPGNLLRPGFLRMLRDIRRLGRERLTALDGTPDSCTLGDVVQAQGYSRELVEWYLVPMAAAIWSAPRANVLAMPAHFFFSFFDNHGMLDLRRRPEWRTIVGGSREYVSRLAAPFRANCRMGSAVRSVERTTGGVVLTLASGVSERHDEVVLALHSDDALELLADPSEAEREILGAMPYAGNDIVVHTDPAAMPRRRRAWCAWNYRLLEDDTRPVGVTYNLSILQSLRTRDPVCVTLNEWGGIDASRVVTRLRWRHPQYTVAGVGARGRWREISGVRRTHYCGAYWGNGFHEDGVASAHAVAALFGHAREAAA